ncbi:esterase-like activity of phytase family protein [Palleronia salina]|nr:esterase-like activity of phytase family protein [Palleronia salina]
MPGRPGALILATLLAMAAAPIGAAEFVGAWEWEADGTDFGGFSGLELSADGITGHVLDDSARLMGVTLDRDAAGAVTGVTITSDDRLHDPRGRTLMGDYADSEGLAVDPQGRLTVSFENWPRLWVYDTPGGPATALPFYPGFMSFRTNGGLEALAMDGDGALYTLPERLAGDLPSPLLRLRGGEWEIVGIPEIRHGFRPVGADFDDRGRLYILERKFQWIGFRSRVRRLTLDDQGIAREDVLLTSRLRQHDNLEGIAIWRDDRDRLRATMVSDDNFLPVQRTEFVDYILPD